MTPNNIRLDLQTLRNAYLNGLDVRDLIEAVWHRCQADDSNAFIHRLSPEALAPYVDRLLTVEPSALPLYGVPFVIKDNIDLAGVPTTAGCPEFAYTPQKHAHVVQQLIEAGAIPMAKANLDQFATGLNGTRSPHGACKNAFNPQYISGGSSSGSAVSVAKGWASFALGTDTAGSGRVPAAFNNIVGLKPTCGLLSATGVVPACRSIDTISIFALNACDAHQVFLQAAGHDAADAYSRRAEPYGLDFAEHGFRVGVPNAASLAFFDDPGAQAQFAAALDQLKRLGAELVEIDFAPFLEAARLLYDGPFVAERYVALERFMATHAQHVIEPVKSIVLAGQGLSAAQAFAGMYQLKHLKRVCDAVWQRVDCLVTPTAGTIYTIAAMQASPVALNSNLGRYTNFMNLLDYAAVAVPAGMLPHGPNAGLPFGITLAAPAHKDTPLLKLADRFHRQLGIGPGVAVHETLPAPQWASHIDIKPDTIEVAVCGAHLSGLPLNHQLTSRGARLLGAFDSAPQYRLYALSGAGVARPGMVRVLSGGESIAMELWALPAHTFGSFVAGIASPLGMGKVQLADGRWVCGFVCESAAVGEGATDITHHQGWRRYLSDTR
ncbi:MAG: Allophanate hydrolase [Pseudomonadota bacterium]|jgi:allophanate hydrolase